MYTELQVTSNFSFLRGASHPEELVEQAAAMGYTSIAITDRNSFAGIVRAHVAAKKTGIRLIIGCRIDLVDGPSLLAYPVDTAGYSWLCQLLTTGNLRTEKGECLLYKKDVYQHERNIKFIVIPPVSLNEQFEFDGSFSAILKEYHQHFGNHLYIAGTRKYEGKDNKYLYRIAQLSSALGIPMVATNDIHYHEPARRELQDILTCIREKCTIYNAGFRLHPNAERFLKTQQEMLRLFRQYPDAVRYTQEIALYGDRKSVV